MEQDTARQMAKKALLEYLTARRVTEKAREALGPERELWHKRAALAQEKGAVALEAAAHAELRRLQEKEAALTAELAEIDSEIAALRAEQSVVPPLERSVDTDVLEAELRISLGYGPDEEEGEHERKCRELAALQREAEVETALAALKARQNPPPRPSEP